MRFQFNAKYLGLFLGLFLVETGIALYVHDHFVRPFVGDVLVVILLYAFVRTFLEPARPWVLALAILIFAYLIEVAQYFSFVSRLGLADIAPVRIILGSTFDARDLLAYTLGFGLILLGSRFRG